MTIITAHVAEKQPRNPQRYTNPACSNHAEQRWLNVHGQSIQGIGNPIAQNCGITP